MNFPGADDYLKKFNNSIETGSSISDVRIAYDNFQEVVLRTLNFELSDIRMNILKDMIQKADKMLSEFIANNAK